MHNLLMNPIQPTPAWPRETRISAAPKKQTWQTDEQHSVRKEKRERDAAECRGSTNIYWDRERRLLCFSGGHTTSAPLSTFLLNTICSNKHWQDQQIIAQGMCWSPTRCCREQFQTGTLPNRLNNISKGKKKVKNSACLVVKRALVVFLWWSRLCNNKLSLNHSSWILWSWKKKSNYHLNQPEYLSALKMESHQRIRGNAPSTDRDVIKWFKVSEESPACKGPDKQTALKSC